MADKNKKKKAKKKGPPRLHKKRSKAHPGFNAVAAKIKKKGASKKSSKKIAGAIYQKLLKKKRGK